ncbi:hypothetical protein HDU87_001342 [Geranomyces variabilis]|uniref:Transmembrane protein n=1 Tax=Geranomyces variabilis TaxID=109894 RepID=A0AAD5TPJ4_9FUNG|nr:hypothetical protein HDU87_001342 [Geranomyces variabilis]
MAEFEAVDKLMQMEAISPAIDAKISAEYQQWDDQDQMYGRIKAIVFAFATFSYVSLVLWRFKLTASSVPIWVTKSLFVFAVVIHVISITTYAYFIAHPESAYYDVAEITAALLALFTLVVDNLLSWTFMQSVLKISRILNAGVEATDLQAQGGGGLTTKKSAFSTVGTKRTEGESDSDGTGEPEACAGKAEAAASSLPPSDDSSAAGAVLRPSPSVLTALRTEDQERVLPPLQPSLVATGVPAPSQLGIVTDSDSKNNNQDVEQGTPAADKSQRESPQGRGRRQRSTAAPVALAGVVQSGRRALWLLGLLCVISFANLIIYGVQLKVTDPYNKILLHVVAGLGPLLQAACFMGFLVTVRLFLEARVH